MQFKSYPRAGAAIQVAKQGCHRICGHEPRLSSLDPGKAEELFSIGLKSISKPLVLFCMCFSCVIRSFQLSEYIKSTPSTSTKSLRKTIANISVKVEGKKKKKEKSATASSKHKTVSNSIKKKKNLFHRDENHYSSLETLSLCSNPCHFLASKNVPRDIKRH